MLGFLFASMFVERRVQKLMDRNGITNREKVVSSPRNSDTSHIFKKRSVRELLELSKEN